MDRQTGINTDAYIKAKFAEYYQKHDMEIKAPPLIEQREFGFFLLKERMMVRHKGFRNIGGFRSFVKKVIPSDVFYSSAYYENPELEMGGKGWLGADLFFDVDADHILTPCTQTHDKWICNKCGATGRGNPPHRCSICNQQNFSKNTWSCEVCLASAKAEIIKLMDLLIDDLGLTLKEMKIAFSGHRGYHLQVESDDIRKLTALTRKEIVDYIVGKGLDPLYHGLEEWRKKGSGIVTGPALNDRGWRGRIAKGTYELLLTGSKEELEKIGVSKTVAKHLLNHRKALIASWEKKGPWGSIKGVGRESWKKIVQQGIDRQSVKIDTVVTTDIHRLMRFTNTLHGKTGLLKTEVSTKSIEKFDPLTNAVAFTEGEKTIRVTESPQFRLGDELYGPYKNKEVELPTSAALLLLCKGYARVIN